MTAGRPQATAAARRTPETDAPGPIAISLPGAEVRFTTRAGGVSEGPFASLNVGVRTGDDVERVVENRRLLAARIGLEPERVVLGRQVHGVELREWDGPPPAGFADATVDRPAVDGHVTDVRGLGLLVQVADCLPVALAAPGRLAMLHCGWRGLADGIVARAVAAFDAPPTAVVGPGIGRCCFEVGLEVIAAFADVDGAAAPAGKALLDLRLVAETRLRAAGVERVEHVDLCTACHPDLFFSHRRDDGVTGRQAGVAWLT